MRKMIFALLAMLVLLAGCASTDVTEDVLFGIEVWRDNTIKMSESYNTLLDRSVPPAGPEDETDADKEKRVADWEDHVAHERALMEANNALAKKTYTWAKTCYDGGQNDGSSTQHQE